MKRRPAQSRAKRRTKREEMVSQKAIRSPLSMPDSEYAKMEYDMTSANLADFYCRIDRMIAAEKKAGTIRSVAPGKITTTHELADWAKAMISIAGIVQNLPADYATNYDHYVHGAKKRRRPCLRGMPIRVADVLDMLAAGESEEAILTDYPYLQAADIHACLKFAANTVSRFNLDSSNAIPASEVWLFNNPAALASVKRGIKQAAEGKLVDLGSFAKTRRRRSRTKGPGVRAKPGMRT